MSEKKRATDSSFLPRLFVNMGFRLRTPFLPEATIPGSEYPGFRKAQARLKKVPVPMIEGDAFRKGRARKLLLPGLWGLNDHCFFRDSQGTIHCIGIRDPFLNRKLFHAISPSFDSPFKYVAPIRCRLNEAGLWAPCAVVQKKTVYLFYTDPAGLFKIGKPAPFRLSLLTSSVDSPFRWQARGVLFSGLGEIRDPCVVQDPVSGKYLLYYHRTSHPKGKTSAISFKTSRDLIHWSAETWDALVDISSDLAGGCAESPQVVAYRGIWYLFFTHTGQGYYTRTEVYVSSNPYWFGKGGSPRTVLWTHAPEIIRENEKWWITCAGHTLHARLAGCRTFRSPGIAIARLLWK